MFLFLLLFFFFLVPVIVLRDEFRLEPQNTRVALGDVAIMECGPPRGTPEPVIYTFLFSLTAYSHFYRLENVPLFNGRATHEN